MLIELFYKFFMIGLFSFGGGYAMFPLFQREFIETGIITAERFTEIMTISQMTPGSFAINAATFIGKDKAGILGSILSTIAVSLPSLIIILLLMKTLQKYKEHPIKKSIFKAMRPAVLGFIFAAVILLAGQTAINGKMIAMFFMSIALIASKKIHPVLVIFIMGGINMIW